METQLHQLENSATEGKGARAVVSIVSIARDTKYAVGTAATGKNGYSVRKKTGKRGKRLRQAARRGDRVASLAKRAGKSTGTTGQWQEIKEVKEVDSARIFSPIKPTSHLTRGLLVSSTLTAASSLEIAQEVGTAHREGGQSGQGPFFSFLLFSQ